MKTNQQIPLCTSYWQNLDFFKGLSPEILKNILTEAEVVMTNSKKNIFYEGDSADHFGFVIEGIFKIHRNDQLGQRVAMDFVAPGGMIAGLLMADDESVYPVNVHSIKAGKFLKIPRTTYKNFWASEAEIMKRVQVANRDRVNSLQTLRESQRLPLEQRVAWVLVKLLSDYQKNEKLLMIYFSRVDVADAIGAAPESIIRVFSKWLKDGIIIAKNNEEYVDIERLKQDYLPTNQHSGR